MGEKQKGKETASSPLPAFGLAEDILGPDLKKEKESDIRGSKDDAQIKYVTFFLEGEEYALPISQVQEIKRVGEITRVPNAPEHVKGVMNLRGRIVPVIELKKRLQLGEALVDKDSRIVVVEHGPKVLGLMVDRVAQVLNIGSEQIDKAPEEVVQVDENYIRGVGKMDERMVILLDLDRIVGKEVGA